MLLTAWIGTPIHEFSHVIAAVITGHKIMEVKLFKPDPRTGTLGYIAHSYNPHNLFQSTIGNTLIAIAPFFGGSLAIYMITYFLLPDFSLYSSDVPSVYYITSENVLSLKSYVLFGKTAVRFFEYLILKVQYAGLLTEWQFYLFLFILLGVANHLSPSYADFQNFWQPLAIIIIFMTLLNIFILPFMKGSLAMINSASKYMLFLMPILLLALFISGIGLLLTTGIYLLTSIFRK